jgi:hypothetical protein
MTRRTVDSDAMHREEAHAPETAEELRAAAEDFATPEIDRVRETVAALVDDLAAAGWPDPRRMVQVDADGWREPEPTFSKLQRGRAYTEEHAGPLSEPAAMARVVELGQRIVDAFDRADTANVLHAAVRFGMELERGAARSAFLEDVARGRKVADGARQGGARRGDDPAKRRLIERMDELIAGGKTQRAAARIAGKEFAINTDAAVKRFQRAPKN